MSSMEALMTMIRKERVFAPLHSSASEIEQLRKSDMSTADSRRRTWMAIKAAKDITGNLSISSKKRSQVMDLLKSVKEESEREEYDAKVVKEDRHDETFATLAYFFANGRRQDLPAVLRMSRSNPESVPLADEVQRAVTIRELEVERRKLLVTYHKLLFKLQRGVGSEEDQNGLSEVASALDECEEQLGRGGDHRDMDDEIVGEISKLHDAVQRLFDRLGRGGA